jgi:hypothetical protein
MKGIPGITQEVRKGTHLDAETGMIRSGGTTAILNAESPRLKALIKRLGPRETNDPKEGRPKGPQEAANLRK